jgi:hypothetical protein
MQTHIKRMQRINKRLRLLMIADAERYNAPIVNQVKTAFG